MSAHIERIVPTDRVCVLIGASHARKLAEKALSKVILIRRKRFEFNDIIALDKELDDLSKVCIIGSILILAGNNLYPGKFGTDKSEQYLIANYDCEKIHSLLSTICTVANKYSRETYFVESPPRGFKILNEDLPWYNYYSSNFRERYKFIISKLEKIVGIIRWETSLGEILNVPTKVINPIFSSMKGQRAIYEKIYKDQTHLTDDGYKAWSKFVLEHDHLGLLLEKHIRIKRHANSTPGETS